MRRLTRQQRFQQSVLLGVHVDPTCHHARLVLGPFDGGVSRRIERGPGGLAVVRCLGVQEDVALAVPAQAVVVEPFAEHVAPRFFRRPGHLFDKIFRLIAMQHAEMGGLRQLPTLGVAWAVLHDDGVGSVAGQLCSPGVDVAQDFQAVIIHRRRHDHGGIDQFAQILQPIRGGAGLIHPGGHIIEDAIGPVFLGVAADGLRVGLVGPFEALAGLIEMPQGVFRFAVDLQLPGQRALFAAETLVRQVEGIIVFTAVNLPRFARLLKWPDGRRCARRPAGARGWIDRG